MFNIALIKNIIPLLRNKYLYNIIIITYWKYLDNIVLYDDYKTSYLNNVTIILQRYRPLKMVISDDFFL